VKHEVGRQIEPRPLRANRSKAKLEFDRDFLDGSASHPAEEQIPSGGGENKSAVLNDRDRISSSQRGRRPHKDTMGRFD
jgi:hypothetical protein